jgi:hypothetical protein
VIDRRRDATPEESTIQATALPRRRRTTARLLVGFFGGAVVALIGGVVAMVLLYRDPLPALTEESLAAAKAHWAETGIDDYSLEVEILGRQPGVVKIKVRDGEPVEMTRDGRVPEQRRTWAAWTVPSQFDMLATELRGQQNPSQGYNAPAGSQVVLKAEFDPTLGYPLHVRRQVLGTELNVEWRVTKFETD